MNSLHTFSASGVSNTLFSFALLGAGRGDVRPSNLLVTGLSVQVTPVHGLPGHFEQRYHPPPPSSTLPATLPATFQHPPPSSSTLPGFRL